MAAAYFTNQASTYFSAPYAYLIWLLVRQAAPAYFSGSTLIVGQIPIQFEDVCTGILLIGMAVVFLWLRSASKRLMATTAALLFAFNTLRVVSVILVLTYFDLAAAAALHDGFYAVFTAVAIGITVYGAWPLLAGKEKAEPPPQTAANGTEADSATLNCKSA